MKKIYSLFALLVMMFAAVGVNAQKYSLDQQGDLPEPGVQYALYNTSRMVYAGSTANGATDQIVDETNLWEFEKTGNSIDGYDLYRIKNVGNGKYWQEIDFENNIGLDGYDVFGYIGCNAAWGDAAGAMEVTIAQADGADQRTSGSATSGGLIIMRKNPVPQDAENTWYYKLDTQESGVWNVAFTPWNEGNVWQIWTVRENTAQDKLQILVDGILEEDLQFIVGPEPGKYPQAKVDAYQKILDEAQEALVQSKTEAEYTALFDKLNNAYTEIKNGANPVVAGYYYIVSGYEAFEEQQGSEKAMFGYSTAKPRWKNLDPADYSFLWKIEKKGDGWALINVLYNTYLHGSDTNGNSAKLRFDANSDRTVYFEVLSDAQWKIYNSFCQIGYHTESHSAGAGKEGDLVTWNTGAHNGSAWILRPVTDQEYINGAIKQQTQIVLQEEMTELIKEAGTIYGQLFVSDADTDMPLITAADDAATGTEGNQFLYNRQHNGEGRYGCLIDGATTADGNYGEDGEWAYFHGCWAGAPISVGAHSNDNKDFMQVDLSKTPVSSFVLKYARRYNNGNAQPTQITIAVANDTTGFYEGTDNAWKTITTIYPTPTAPGVGNTEGIYTSPLIELGANYKYIRFYIDGTNNNVQYATFSEFQLYPGAISEELSQYYYTPGMKAAADKMEADRKAGAAAMEANDVKQSQIDALKADIKAVKALFADPAEFAALIAQTELDLQYAEVGEEFGQIATDATVEAYTNALADAQAVEKVTLEAVNALKNARKAFLEDMNTPEAGKWYYIVSRNDQTRGTEENPVDSYDSPMYAETVGAGAAVRWAPNYAGEKDEAALAIWRMIPVEGAETPNTVYIQNMGTGLYMGGESVNTSYVTHLTEKPVAFTLTHIGGARLAICATENNTNNLGLHAQVAGPSVVGWYYNVGGVDAQGNPSNTASLWSFTEIDPEMEGVVIPVAVGTNVVTLPFAVADLADYNEGVTTYGVANIEGEEVSLYEKSEFAAGEPFILSYEAETEDGATTADLIVVTPADVTTKAGQANGLVGALSAITVPAAGVGIVKEGEWVAAEATDEVAAQTGYIDPSTFKAPVAGAAIATTITIDGLQGAGVKGDVNADGKVNSTDIVAIYNYIAQQTGVTAAAADVNGDEKVNSADVVTVYNLIAGGSSKAPAFVLPGTVVGDETIEGSTNVVTIKVGDTDDLTKIPVTVYLNNPGVNITCVEVNMEAPVAVTKWDGYYDEDEEAYVWNYDKGSRWKSNHTATITPGTKTHGENALFISVPSSTTQSFRDEEGAIITICFDGSELADGSYSVRMFDSFSVWSDKVTNITYTSPEMNAEFAIEGGKATAVESITAEEIAAAKAIYTIAGQPVAEPVKGQIYVVDGKTVKF